MSRIKVGLQLYTVRDQTAEDFVGTLEKVAELGYEAVEFAGYGGIEASEMKKTLDRLGLEAISSHVPMDLLENELDQQIAYSQEIGAKYIMCPIVDPAKYADEESFNRTVEQFQQIGEKIRSAGLQFGYHNHAFEFERLNDEYILDKLYAAVPAELLVAELDLYWIKKAGVDPKSYMLKYKGRTPIIHLKDMTGDERGTFAEVGHGIIDFPSIFEIAAENGVQYYIVEQDFCERHPFDSIKMSIDYLKEAGIV